MKNLTEAWNNRFYGPFKTRRGSEVCIVERVVTVSGWTTYLMSDSYHRYPSGVVCMLNHITEKNPGPGFSIVFKTERKKDTIITDSRLVHLQKIVKQSQEDLKRYIKKHYPSGSYVTFNRGNKTFRLCVTKLNQNTVSGIDIETGKHVTVPYKMLTGKVKEVKKT